MELRNCRRCGKMYGFVSGIPICDQCRQKDEDDFQRVKEYINDNRGASMKEISDACEVSIEKITRFLRDGRLEIKEGTNIVLECENCGQAIKSGRYCPDCSKKLERELTQVSHTTPSLSDANKNKDADAGKSKGGMRYLKS